MILILSSDLATSSQIAAGAQRAGCETASAMTRAAAIERCRQGAPRLVVVDLASPWADLASLVGELRGATTAELRIVAFGPHVREELLQSARDAGCDEVLSRGKFLATLEARLAALHPAG